jgi:hypothetical protein
LPLAMLRAFRVSKDQLVERRHSRLFAPLGGLPGPI